MVYGPGIEMRIFVRKVGKSWSSDDGGWTKNTLLSKAPSSPPSPYEDSNA